MGGLRKEPGAGWAAAFAIFLFVFNRGLALIDWVGRGEVVMPLGPYLHFLIAPWASLPELAVSAYLVFYATRLEIRRENDELPRILLPNEPDPMPTRRWIWIKLTVISTCIGMIIVGGLYFAFKDTRAHDAKPHVAEIAPAAGQPAGRPSNTLLPKAGRSLKTTKRHAEREPSQDHFAGQSPQESAAPLTNLGGFTPAAPTQAQSPNGEFLPPQKALDASSDEANSLYSGCYVPGRSTWFIITAAPSNPDGRNAKKTINDLIILGARVSKERKDVTIEPVPDPGGIDADIPAPQHTGILIYGTFPKTTECVASVLNTWFLTEATRKAIPAPVTRYVPSSRSTDTVIWIDIGNGQVWRR